MKKLQCDIGIIKMLLFFIFNLPTSTYGVIFLFLFLFAILISLIFKLSYSLYELL